MITKSALKKTIAMAAVVLLVGATNTACSMPLPEGTGKCEFRAENPHESHDKPGYIDGKTKVKCTIYAGHTLSTLSVTTKLQKLSNGSWVDVSGSSNTTVWSYVKSGYTYTAVSGFITCRKGTFRTAGRGSAYLDGEYSASGQWGYGNQDNEPVRLTIQRLVAPTVLAVGATSAVCASAGSLAVSLPALAILVAVAALCLSIDRRNGVLLIVVVVALAPMLAGWVEATPVVGAVGLTALLWGRPEGRSLVAKAPPNAWLLGAGVAVAVSVFALWWHQTFIAVQAGSFSWSRPELPAVGLPLIIAGLVLGAALNAVFEELLWRAVLADMPGEPVVGNIAWLVFVSAGFGLSHLHGTPGGWIGVAATFCFGLAMASLRRFSRGTIVVCVVTHFVADLILLWGLYG